MTEKRFYHKPQNDLPETEGIFMCLIYGSSSARLQLVGEPETLNAFERRHRLVRIHIDNRDTLRRHAT